jgi:hypothetical protein
MLILAKGAETSRLSPIPKGLQAEKVVLLYGKIPPGLVGITVLS